MNSFKTVVLAAGEGKRMKSHRPKVLHEAAGKSLLAHVLSAADRAGSAETAVITGNGAELVQAALPEDVRVFYQAEQLGTGHAVMQAEPFFQTGNDIILVLCGDAPLIKPATLRGLIDSHVQHRNDVTVLTAEFDDPTGYGRMITSDSGELLKIVEHRDAAPEELKVKEINSSIYCFNAEPLRTALASLTTDNDQKEYYLTDAIALIREAGGRAGTFIAEDANDIAAVNSKAQLAEVAKIFRDRINTKLMDDGVILIDPQAVYIDADVKIGRDTVVWPGNIIQGHTVIGEDCVVGQNCRIVNAQIADNVDLQSSTVLDSRIGSGTHVGPYAYVRPNCSIGEDVKVGDFVEVKNSVMKNGAKASHLTYIGDAEVGERVNLGCGTVFVNYDGIHKNRTVVGDDCFIGCNSNLISPLTVENGAYIAAGSTVTNDVPEDTLAIARARQVNKDGYVRHMDIYNKKKGD